MGGSISFREAWRHYYADCYGFIYVIDCSTEDRFDENRQVFQRLLEEEKVHNKPILMYESLLQKCSQIFSSSLANNQDVTKACHKETILQYLDNEVLLTKNSAFHRMVTANAVLF